MNDRIVLDEREVRILERVRDEGSASIERLAAEFGVTQQTIRRVVNRLCEQGLLRRVHGGVSLPVADQNLAYESRQGWHLDGKNRIARAVSESIPDGASLLIGLGTTPECVARALARRQHFHVITNSLNVAAALARNPTIDITIAGGTLRPRDRDVIGEPSVQFFSRFKADFGIFGVGGIDEDGSLLDFHSGEVEARQAIVANSRTALLVADRSKFGRNATVRGGHLRDADVLFTDEPLPQAFSHCIEQCELELRIAPADKVCAA